MSVSIDNYLTIIYNASCNWKTNNCVETKNKKLFKSEDLNKKFGKTEEEFARQTPTAYIQYNFADNRIKQKPKQTSFRFSKKRMYIYKFWVMGLIPLSDQLFGTAVQLFLRKGLEKISPGNRVKLRVDATRRSSTACFARWFWIIRHRS
jgi:hypothetical protein